MADQTEFAAGRPAVAFNQTHPADRDAVAVAIALCWFGLLSGFIPDMLREYNAGHSYVPSAHVHAASAFGWMVLLSWQALKVRRGRMIEHRRDGWRFGPWLAAIVTLSALVTVWTADRVLLPTPDFNPARLAFQVGHIIPFAILSGIALWRTDRPDLHKRLMLLAVFAILDTGWSRWLGEDIRAVVGSGLAGQLLGRFPLTWALMAATLILATEFGAAALFFAPWWPDLARHLLGG
jgi:hypothetical protein